MANETRSINLLPGSHDEGFLTQFLNWAISIGRLLIILTETLALGTFLFRFGLDMRIVDLHDEIKANSFIVENFKNSEEKFRDIQTRLALAKAYDATGTKTALLFGDIAELGRGRVTFQNLLITTENIKIELQAPSRASLEAFVRELRKHPEITSISIDKIENKVSTATIAVALTANLVSAQPTPVAQTVIPAEQQTEAVENPLP